MLFQENYNVSLYSAHLEALYKGLLIHLDDPETRIQEAVLGNSDLEVMSAETHCFRIAYCYMCACDI